MRKPLWLMCPASTMPSLELRRYLVSHDMTFNLSATNKALLPVQHGLLLAEIQVVLGHKHPQRLREALCIFLSSEKWGYGHFKVHPDSVELWLSSGWVCLCTNIELATSVSYFILGRDSSRLFKLPCIIMWGGGVKQEEPEAVELRRETWSPRHSPSFSHPFKGKQQCGLGSFGFILRFSLCSASFVHLWPVG